MTVVETPEFQRRAKAVLTEAERETLIGYLAANPEAGVLIGGGLRKIRFARPGAGKSGGYRVVHYYRTGAGLPLFLITMFAKNEKSNLTAAETALVVKAGEAIAASYGRRE